MDILLYKDGHLTISESPLQGKENNLDDAVMLISNPQEGDTLTYKSGKWVNGEGGGGGSFAPDITNPQDGDTLVYNATAGKWVNGSGGGGDIEVLHIIGDVDNPEPPTFDMTYAEVLAAITAGKSVLVEYNGLIGAMKKDSEYSEIYTSFSNAEMAEEGVAISMYYVEMTSEDSNITKETQVVPTT